MITIRAVLALAVLRGYWMGRLLVIAGLAGAAGWCWIAGTVESALALTALAVLAAVLSVRAARVIDSCVVPPRAGTLVAQRGNSPLWNEVRALCTHLEVRLPDEIRLGTDPEVAVSEQARRYGLVAGPRQLYIGLPLLAGLDTGQLRSLLSHELAHDSRNRGHLPAVCHRVRSTVGAMLQRRPRNAGVVFAICARLFLALEAPVSRSQEIRADRTAALVSGRTNAVGALRELPVLAVAWRRYLTEVIAPAVRSGYAPLSLTDGFVHARRSWDDELEALGAAPQGEHRTPWDPHPTWLERLHEMDLVTESGSAGQQVGPQLRPSAEVVEVERELIGSGVRRVPWEEFLATLASEALRDEVAHLFRVAQDAAAACGVAAGTEGLDTVLTLIEARQAPALVARLDPATPKTARRLLGVALAQAAVDGGVARWRRNSAGTLQVVRPDGGQVPVEELAARVIADPSTVPVVREILRTVRTHHGAPVGT